jgi:glycosyltransferase involved in cell wall biosynthesis
MKILVFNWRDLRHPDAGGAEVNIHQQVKRWASLGHEVTMFTARPKGQSARDNMDGMEIYRCGGRFGVYIWAVPMYLFKLRRRADVILDIENGIPFFTPLYSRRPKVLLMHHLHQDQFLVEMGPVVGRIGRFMERVLVPLLYKRSAITAVSESTAQRKKAALRGGSKLDIEVIYNGVDHSTYVPGKGKSENPTILYLGRIKRYKRLPRLIAMMPEIRRSIANAELVIAGDGDALDDVAEHVKTSGAADVTSILGRVTEEEKLRLLQRSWVMATPSMNEGWGVTVVETNACGTPAVAFRVPGLDEAIVDGETGFLCDDDSSFVKAVVNVLSDTSSRERLSEQAVKWAERFDWDETARRTLEVLSRQSKLRTG